MDSIMSPEELKEAVAAVTKAHRTMPLSCHDFEACNPDALPVMVDTIAVIKAQQALLKESADVLLGARDTLASYLHTKDAKACDEVLAKLKSAGFL